MPKRGEYADILRALGRFLDEQQSTSFEAVIHLEFLALSWDTLTEQGQQRAYQEHQLQELRAQSRALRQPTQRPLGSTVELMRVVGQEIDRQAVELIAIGRDADSFRISGVRDGMHFRATYRTKDLIALGAARRKARGQGTQAATALEPAKDDSFVGVVVGADVLTEEGRFLGRIGEVKGRTFRIGKPFLDADYWLPAESVTAIGPNGEVILSELSKKRNG